jgi:biopolymer transport protein ExbD
MPVDLLTLRQYLDQTTNMTPVPELHLRPEAGAKYELVDEVLAITKRANITAMGFVGNEYYANAF